MKTPALVLSLLSFLPAAFGADYRMTVYKTATCGCCAKWVEHMKANGFDAVVHNVPGTAEARARAGVPVNLASCHTAVVNGYSLEGHVPADDVLRLIKSKSKVKGLAVPGMPIGSPGMEQGERRDAYSVIAFDAAGKVSEFQSYKAR